MITVKLVALYSYVATPASERHTRQRSGPCVFLKPNRYCVLFDVAWLLATNLGNSPRSISKSGRRRRILFPVVEKSKGSSLHGI